MGSIEEFIENYHLVVDSSKSSDKILYIRSSICSEKEAKSFMKKFEQRTCTIWRVQYGNFNPQRVVFRKAWVCRHSSIRSADVKEKNCLAKLDILVKKINPYTTKNDTFLLKKPPLPCIIRMHFKHNHNCEDDFKYLKVPDAVKDIFYSFFDSGYGVTKALRLHEQHLKRDETLSIAHFIPTNIQAYHLYRMWQRRFNDANSGVNNEPWIVFDWDELISTIPRENPPAKSVNKMTSDSQISFSDDENSETKELVPVTDINITEQISNSVTATSNSVKPENSSTQVLYILGEPVPAQHIANSSNHLNGSILTVMNSNCFLSSSSLVSSPTSSTLTPISSTGSLDAVSSKPLLHLSKQNSSELESSMKDTSEASVYILQAATSRSNYLHQSKVLDLSNTGVSSHFLLPKYPTSGSELKSIGCSSEVKFFSDKDFSLSSINGLNSMTGQIPPTIFKGINFNSSSPINQISSTSSNDRQITEKPNILNSQTSLSFLLDKPKDNSNIASPVNNLLLANRDCSNTSTNTQIHITNTVHQSGAQICMKSSVPPIVAFHASEILAHQASSEELIKIKEEPTDDENSDFSPTIIKIASVSAGETLRNELVVPVPSIKKEKVENDTVEERPFLDDSANAVSVDEDKKFLMSLLQELKVLPTQIKNKLKRDMQNLVTSAISEDNCRKRGKL